MSCAVVRGRHQGGPRRRPGPVCAMGLLFLCLPALQAQTLRCKIAGQVVDSSGAPLDGVAVVLAGPGADGAQVTSDRGEFCFTEIGNGPATLTMSRRGFATTAIKDLLVPDGERLQVRVVMGQPILVTEALGEEQARPSPEGAGASWDEGGLTCKLRDPWPLLLSLTKSGRGRSGRLDTGAGTKPRIDESPNAECSAPPLAYLEVVAIAERGIQAMGTDLRDFRNHTKISVSSSGCNYLFLAVPTADTSGEEPLSMIIDRSGQILSWPWCCVPGIFTAPSRGPGDHRLAACAAGLGEP